MKLTSYFTHHYLFYVIGHCSITAKTSHQLFVCDTPRTDCYNFLTAFFSLLQIRLLTTVTGPTQASRHRGRGYDSTFLVISYRRILLFPLTIVAALATGISAKKEITKAKSLARPLLSLWCWP